MENSQIALLDEPAHILLVEDDHDDVLLIKRAFGSILENFVLTVAENGQKGLDHLHSENSEQKFDIVILDINMPVMDGYQFLERLRADERSSKVPVVVLTTTNNKAQLDKAYELGANTVIQKDKFFELAPEVAQVLIDYWYRLAHIPDRQS